jgi:hypothetical protein
MLVKTLFILVIFVVGADQKPYATTDILGSLEECMARGKLLGQAREAMGYALLATACVPAPPFKSNERAS